MTTEPWLSTVRRTSLDRAGTVILRAGEDDGENLAMIRKRWLPRTRRLAIWSHWTVRPPESWYDCTFYNTLWGADSLNMVKFLKPVYSGLLQSGFPVKHGQCPSVVPHCLIIFHVDSMVKSRTDLILRPGKWPALCYKTDMIEHNCPRRSISRIHHCSPPIGNATNT